MKYKAAYKLLAADNECHTTRPGSAGRFLSRVMVCYPGIVPALSRKFLRPIPLAKSQNSRSAQHMLFRSAHHLAYINLNFPYLVWLRLISTTPRIGFNETGNRRRKKTDW